MKLSSRVLKQKKYKIFNELQKSPTIDQVNDVFPKFDYCIAKLKDTNNIEATLKALHPTQSLVEQNRKLIANLETQKSELEKLNVSMLFIKQEMPCYKELLFNALV